MKVFFIWFLCLYSFNLNSQEINENHNIEIVPPPNSNFDFDEGNDIFIIVEVMPVFIKKCAQETSPDDEYQCSKLAIQEYISETEYPQEAINKNLQGKVYVSFVVQKDGYVSDVELLKGVHKILDNAFIEHIKKMPRFYKPGKQRGKNVKVKFSVPINFKLEDEDLRNTLRSFRNKYKKENSINLVRLLPNIQL